MSMIASLLVVPLLAIVVLYSSETLERLQETRADGRSLKLVELASEFDAQMLSYYYLLNDKKIESEEVIAQALDTKLKSVSGYVEKHFQGLIPIWQESHVRTHNIVKQHSNQAYGDERYQEIQKIVQLRSQFYDEVFLSSGLHRYPDRNVRTDVLLVLRTMPETAQKVFVFSEEVERLKHIQNPVDASKHIKSLMNRLEAMKQVNTQWESTLEDLAFINQRYMNWLNNVGSLLEKEKIAVFAGLLSSDSDVLTSKNEFLLNRTESRQIMADLYGSKMKMVDKLAQRFSRDEKKLLAWLIGVCVVVVLMIGLSAMLAFYIIKNVKFTQQYLSKENQRLEEGIKERTAEIERAKSLTENLNDNLRSAKERAERLANEAESANKAKSLFLASMSHEIRTPLNSVIGGGGILKKTPLNDKQKEILKLINQSGYALLELVNDILDFSKIEAGELVLEDVEYDLEAIALELINIMSIRAVENGIYLKLDFDVSCEGTWRGDPTRIKQIVMNLLSNAIKFTHEGGVTLHIKLEGNGFNCSVKDTGIGIPDNKISSLFDAFVQTDNSITRQYGGTGLGLSISKKLCELMGGKINVTSVLDEGSEFSFFVPNTHTHTVNYDQGVGDVLLLGNYACATRDLTKFGFTVHSIEAGGGANIESDMGDHDVTEWLNTHSKPELVLMCIDDYVRYQKDWNLPIDDNVPIAVVYDFNSDHYLDQVPKNIHRINCQEKASTLRDKLLFLCGKIDSLDTPDDFQEGSVRFKGNVLLVEDVEYNQIIAGEVLDEYGVKVDFANNGEEAVRLIKEKYEGEGKGKNYDLILMDLHMPVMDGLTATSVIRAYEKDNNLEELPIYAMTADVLVDTQHKIYDVGMNGYLPKPFRDEEMLAVLTKVLPIDHSEPSKERKTEGQLGNETRENQSTEAVLNNTQEPVTDSERGRTTGASNDQTTYDSEAIDPQVFDLEAISRRLRNKMNRVEMLCTSFASGLDELFDNIETSFQAGDVDGVKYHCHSLKGSSGNVGAMVLFELSKTIEDHCKEGNLNSAKEFLPQLQQAIEQFKSAVHQAFPQDGSE